MISRDEQGRQYWTGDYNFVRVNRLLIKPKKMDVGINASMVGSHRAHAMVTSMTGVGEKVAILKPHTNEILMDKHGNPETAHVIVDMIKRLADIRQLRSYTVSKLSVK